jgi:SnoaL-like polyketide cyclase
MPDPKIVDLFIQRVVSGAHAEAIEEFYAPDASMQENMTAPRVGRDALVQRERAVLARVREVITRCVEPVFIQGDHVVIRWIFEFSWLDGRSSRIEELAYQRWVNNKIQQETFFYDPVQMTPR